MKPSPACRARDIGHVCSKPTGHDGRHACFCNKHEWNPEPTAEEASA